MLPLFACILLCSCAQGLQVLFEWKSLNFGQLDDRFTDFIPENNVPVGIEIWHNKLFITVPRWKPGVPVSLAYIDIKEAGKNKSPTLMPYPNWAAHDLGRREKGQMNIVSPFRMKADSCDRLWVLDTGMTDILGSVEHFGPNQLLVFDLHSDKLLRRFVIPNELLTKKSFFANLAVDVKHSTCNESFAYLADLGSFSMVVYSWKDNHAWLVEHHYFHSDPMAGDYNVSGLNFQWTDGLFGLALSKENDEDGYRTLYFHPFSSFSEFSVSTRILQNESLWSDPIETARTYHEFKLLGSRGTHSQSCASFLDEKSGVLFYTQVTQNAVSCWNTRHAYTAATQGQVAVDNVTMVFPNDLKVDADRNLWVLTDRMPLFLYGNLNFSDVNFRVLSAPVDEAIAHTVCSSSGQSPLSCFGPITFVVLLWCLKVLM